MVLEAVASAVALVEVGRLVHFEVESSFQDTATDEEEDQDELFLCLEKKPIDRFPMKRRFFHRAIFCILGESPDVLHFFLLLFTPLWLSPIFGDAGGRMEHIKTHRSTP